MTTTEKQYKFSTMTAERFNEQDMNNFTNHFDTIWISKEPFTVELDTKKIKLHLFIEYLDMSECIADEKERMLANPAALLYDILVYGYKIALHTETTEDLNKVDHLIKSAVAVSPCVSGLIGFDLDRVFNRIGNTGWDFLSNYCENANLVQLAMNKYNKRVRE